MLDNRKIMTDEKIGKATVALQAAEEVEHLRLNGNIERRNWLVADDNLRVEHKRTCHINALTLTTRKLVRIALHMLHVEANLLHEVEHDLLTLLLVGLTLVNLERLLDCACRGKARIERRIGILEHHLNVLAHGFELSTLESGDVISLVENLTGGRPM